MMCVSAMACSTTFVAPPGTAVGVAVGVGVTVAVLPAGTVGVRVGVGVLVPAGVAVPGMRKSSEKSGVALMCTGVGVLPAPDQLPTSSILCTNAPMVSAPLLMPMSIVFPTAWRLLM